MHQVGLLGQPRRYADIRPMLDTEAGYAIILMNKISTHSIFVFAAAQVIFAFQPVLQHVFGEKVDRNPWRSNSLEWEAPSPPAAWQFRAYPGGLSRPLTITSPILPRSRTTCRRLTPPIPGEEEHTGH
jgi:heme/copper-type cytochrome/quinol oxidase subunit 1